MVNGPSPVCNQGLCFGELGMPHIAKGGKYIFGWSLVGEDGTIVIPGEAVKEYHLVTGEKTAAHFGQQNHGRNRGCEN